MKNLITYVDINIDDNLKRYPLHIKMFGAAEPEPSTLEWLHRTYERFGKLKPTYAVQQVIEGVTITYIIDGWKSRIVSERMGATSIKVAVLNLTEEKDIAQVMVELQKSHHTSLEEEYSTYETLYAIFSKGRGHRSDLVELTDTDAEEAGIDEKETKKRRETVYDVIGKMCGVGKNRVMYILKIGKVNPWHFERIEKGRYPLYAAYLKCIAEEKGEEPEVPKVKAPVYHSASTEVPAYSQPTTTADNSTTAVEVVPNTEKEAMTSTSNPVISAAKNNEVVNIQVQVDKNLLHAADMNAAPEVTVNDQDEDYIVVQLKFPKI